MLRFFAFAVLLCVPDTPVLAESISGPVSATVEKVTDGDTLLVRAAVWPGHVVRVSVRIRGIDAPEKRSRCEAEREAALRARAALEGMVGSHPVIITNISGDKYFGRVLAEVTTHDGRAVARDLLVAGLVRPYRGGRRLSAC